jgi:hypothetical protein
VAKKRPDHPSIVILPNGKRYRATVFAILDRHEDGTPKNLRLVKDTTLIKLSDNPEDNQFMICYVSDVHFQF